ncbi:MAG: DUF485 domain-containing protein [Bryobacteraceae bacterium]
MNSRDPQVEQIIGMRRRRSFALSVVVSLIYAAVALGCAFAPGFMGKPILPGWSVSYGVAGMALIMFAAVVSAGYYTWWSNTVRDPLLKKLVESRRGTAG